MQVEFYAKPCNICEPLKKINTLHGNIPPKNIAELKLWYFVHGVLIGPYSNSKSIIQQQPSSSIIQNIGSLTCMTTINPTMGWLEIIEIITYYINEVMGGND